MTEERVLTGVERPPVRVRALVIGTGFSGLGMGIELQKRGIEFLILEKSDNVGGTWHDNVYPGCACDIPSHFYSFSFEPKADWEHLFSYQPEILGYLNRVADKYGLRNRIVFGTRVERATWNDATLRWHVRTSEGQEYIAQFLVSGAGALHIPSIPDIPDRDKFTGHAFHSAQWDKSVDLTGKRVAVVGTGASAIQLVLEIVDQVSELHLYQRTPAWVLPRSNPKFPWLVKKAFEHVPGLRKAFRFGIYCFQESLGYGMTRNPGALKVLETIAKKSIEAHVKDPELRAKLTPSYSIGCKRILNGAKRYYRAIANQKTTLVTDGIARLTPTGIMTTDGTVRDVDVIVWATGFHVSDSYTFVDITGSSGENLGKRWDSDGVSALRGITVAGMPNLFFLLGPNTGLGHNSVVYMIERQIDYVGKAIEALDTEGMQALAPTAQAQAQARFNTKVQRKLASSVWNTGGCASWYLDVHGKNPVLWCGFTWEYALATREVDLKEEYLLYGLTPGVNRSY